MLKIFRKKGFMKTMLWFIAGLMVLSMGIFGTATYLGDLAGGTSAGKIFGKKVSLKEYQKAYQDARDQALMVHGENFEKMSQFLDLEEEAWSRLILAYDAKRRGIKVDDQEVQNYLSPSPMFHREGKFDPYLYQEIIKYIFKRPTRDFEEGIRSQIKIRKLFKEITDTITITEADVLQAYKEEHQRVQVSFVLISPEKYLPNVKINGNEAEDYFSANPQEFEVPPSINVEYITFPFHEDMMDVQKEALADTVRDTIFPEILDKKRSFQDVAEKSNLDIKETGFFNIEQPILSLGWSLDLLQQAFASEKNSFVGPFETENGIQILRIKEKRDSFIPPFNDAKTNVIEAVLNTKALAMAKQKADELFLELSTNTDADLEKVAIAAGFKIEQTPIFGQGEYLPTIGISQDFQEAAFNLTADNPIAGPIKIAKGYALMKLDQFEGIDQEKFEAEKEEFTQNLLARKRMIAMNEFVTQLRAESKLQKFNQRR